MTREITTGHLDNKVLLTFLSPTSCHTFNQSFPVKIDPEHFDNTIWQTLQPENNDRFKMGSGVFEVPETDLQLWKKLYPQTF